MSIQSEYDPVMAIPTVSISALILEQLGHKEMRLLVLVVAVRKSIGPFIKIKGDLSDTVKSTLRRLVASKVVIDVEGVYRLASNES